MNTETESQTNDDKTRAAVISFGHDRLSKQTAARPHSPGRSVRMALRLMDNFSGAVPMRSGKIPPSAEMVAERAWQIWQAEGCPQGRELEHWLKAERELRR